MKKMDMSKPSNQLIIAGLVGMIEDEGLTPHEAFEVVEDIKRNTFHSLMQIKQEVSHERATGN